MGQFLGRKFLLVDFLAFIEKASITVTDCLSGDIKPLGNLLVAQFKTIAKFKEVTFVFGQFSQDGGKLAVFCVFESVGVVIVVLFGGAYQLNTLIDLSFTVDIGSLAVVGYYVFGNRFN